MSFDWLVEFSNNLAGGVKNPARGYKVEKHHPEGENVWRTVLSI